MPKSFIFQRDIVKSGCLAFQTVTNRFTSNWHSHAEYEMVFIEKGAGIIKYGGLLQEYQKGDLFILGPWVPHEFIEKTAIHDSTSILFSEQLLSIDLFQCDLSRKIQSIFKQSIYGLYFNLLPESSEVKLIQSIRTENGIQQAILLFNLLQNLSPLSYHLIQHSALINQSSPKFHKKYTQFQKILAFINEHLFEDITIVQIAKIFYVSRSYLSQLFGEFTQTTFTEYLINQRMFHACRLLSITSKSITEISELVGFKSQSNFNRNFKRVKKISPREYRILSQ